MFDQTFINGKQDVKRPYTIVVSLLLQIGLMCIVILIPLLYSEALPSALLKSMLVAPAPPPVRVPLPLKVANPAAQPRAARRFLAPPSPVVRFVPKQRLDIERSLPAPNIRVPGGAGHASGPAGIAVDSILGNGPAGAPPLSAAPKTRGRPVRVGGRVAEANLMHKVQPEHPALAKSARVQGAVEFTSTISQEGRVENLQLLRGHPLLVNAARQAVLQWRYRPTLLNGQPVEVVTDILVNFTLNP
jgi:periplasmic protein TonB